jgi:hypothetical protein
MRRLRKFWRLAAEDRRLLVKAACLVGIVQLGLWLLPFRTLRRVLAKLSGATPSILPIDEAYMERVVWAVLTASRHLRASTCLVHALAAHVLLTRRGCSAQLRIGVARTAEGRFEAHAWIESHEKVIIGGIENLSRYTPLPPL